MKCQSNIPMRWDISGFTCLENIKNLLHLLVYKQTKFRVSHDHCGTIENLSHQPVFSFAVWKMAVSCEIKWNWMFGKNWTWLLMFLFWLLSLRQHKSEIVLAFPLLISEWDPFWEIARKYCIFCVRQTLGMLQHF